VPCHAVVRAGKLGCLAHFTSVLCTILYP